MHNTCGRQAKVHGGLEPRQTLRSRGSCTHATTLAHCTRHGQSPCARNRRQHPHATPNAPVQSSFPGWAVPLLHSTIEGGSVSTRTWDSHAAHTQRTAQRCPNVAPLATSSFAIGVEPWNEAKCRHVAPCTQASRPQQGGGWCERPTRDQSHRTGASHRANVRAQQRGCRRPSPRASWPAPRARGCTLRAGGSRRAHPALGPARQYAGVNYPHNHAATQLRHTTRTHLDVAADVEK